MRRAGVVAASALLLAGCAPATAGADARTTEVTVYAAASLGSAFGSIADAFEDEYPSTEVTLVLDGSSRLATQLTEGAPADVFASADEPTMRVVTDAGRASSPEIFATNTLVIVVPAGNPADVAALEDLARPEVTTVLCAADVPCGAASRTLLDAAGVEVAAASLEQNVTAVLTKVAADEADAGLVYATDAATRDTVEAIVPVGAAEVVNRYPIVVLDDAPVEAAAFRDFVTGPAGQAILAGDGFGAP